MSVSSAYAAIARKFGLVQWQVDALKVASIFTVCGVVVTVLAMLLLW
jgi:hypothetical protein